MKIYLIAPLNERGSKTTFPLGIASISAALKAAGHEVKAVNLALCEDDTGEVLAEIRDFKPDFVGIGGLTPSFAQIRRVHAAMKHEHPNLPTVLGGGVLTSAAEIVFEDIKPDYGVIGEGEVTIVELAEQLENGRAPLDVNGLILRGVDGSLIRTQARTPLPDLNVLPMPDYEGLGYAKLREMGIYLEILGSRGCPYSCTFCYSPLGRRYRQRSLDHLFREIEHVVKTYDIKSLGITDELFAITPERVKEFCDRIAPLGVNWITQLRVDSVDEDTLRLMRDSGCVMISYGLESMHQDVLKSMNKKTTPAKIERTLELTYDAGMSSFGNFIFGDPAETPLTAEATMDWWFNNRKHLINLGSLQCWPGSKIYKDAVRNGIIANELEFIAEGCPDINLTSMPEHDYWKMLRRAHLYNNALLFPCRVLEVNPDGPGAWSLSTVCPHCTKEKTYNQITNHNVPFNRSTVRLWCECGRMFDLPVLVPLPEHPRELLDEVARLGRLAAAGDQDALGRLEALGSEHLRLANARYMAAKAHWAAGVVDKAYLFTAKGLIADPTFPGLHELMALVLTAMDEPGIARVFHEQASRLRDNQPPGWVSPLMADL